MLFKHQIDKRPDAKRQQSYPVKYRNLFRKSQVIEPTPLHQCLFLFIGVGIAERTVTPLQRILQSLFPHFLLPIV